MLDTKTILACALGCTLAAWEARAGEPAWVRHTATNALVTAGAAESLVRQVESFVIIPGEAHEELWVHPELFTLPGRPVGVELRARTTDRLGKDQHSVWHYFRTDETFRVLRPLEAPTADLWRRKDLTVGSFAGPGPASLKMPESLGHTWCSAYVYLDAETVLQAFTTREGSCYSVRTLAARVGGPGLVPLYVSDAHTNGKGRGLYEPHVAVFRGRCFMTVRAEDGRGYVLVSGDRGRTWSEPRPWSWDSGEAVAMNQTMTKFAAHSEGLALVYTRVRDDNAGVFRNRSPLHVADVDPDALTLRRTTERIIVPRRPGAGKGYPVGNFWVCPLSDRETCVTVAEWPRDGRAENGDIWLAKIAWRKPNRLLTPEGREVPPDAGGAAGGGAD